MNINAGQEGSTKEIVDGFSMACQRQRKKSLLRIGGVRVEHLSI
jgi:hypothetical protein